MSAQAGVISPVLSNLFMHYAFDKWMERNFPVIPFCRYADDVLAHCQHKEEAETLKHALETRLRECGRECIRKRQRLFIAKMTVDEKNILLSALTFLGIRFVREGQRIDGESTSLALRQR